MIEEVVTEELLTTACDEVLLERDDRGESALVYWLGYG